jgi:hypothetical protein
MKQPASRKAGTSETRPRKSFSLALRVLVIEEQQVPVESAVLFLEILGHQVATAKRDRMREAGHGIKPDIVSAIRLPGMNAMRSRSSSGRTARYAIFSRGVTGYAGESDMELGKKSGFEDIHQTVDTDMIHKILKEVRRAQRMRSFIPIRRDRPIGTKLPRDVEFYPDIPIMDKGRMIDDIPT